MSESWWEETDGGDTKVGPGTVLLERYELQKPIGFGGTASVWLATTVDTGDVVAVKIQNPGKNIGAHRSERLEREYQLLSLVDSPHVMKCLDFGNLADGRALLVFEYMRGDSLREVLESHETLALGEALDVFSQLLYALRDSHALGIVHRDLKPDNIMVLDDVVDGVRVKLFDFGISKMLGEDDGMICGRNDPELAELLMPLTAVDMTVGTPEYMAPEQISATDLGRYTDVYAAGIVFYEMLFGEVPYTGKSFFEIAHRHLAGILPPLPADLPEDVQQLIWRALAGNKLDRYQTVDEMLVDVHALMASSDIVDYDAMEESLNPREEMEALFNEPPSPFEEWAEVDDADQEEQLRSKDSVGAQAVASMDELAPWAEPEGAAVVTADEWLRDVSLSSQRVALGALDRDPGQERPEPSLDLGDAFLVPGGRVSGTELRQSVRMKRDAEPARAEASRDTREMSATDREALERDKRATPKRPMVIRRTDGRDTSVFSRTGT